MSAPTEPEKMGQPGPAGSIPQNSQGRRAIEIDQTTEKRVLRKLDRVVVPIVFLAYMFAFLDRSNIGNAETAGMGTDLGFDDSHYQWLLTIFYIPYIIFEWAALMWKVVPPHIWAAITVLSWGIVSTLQAAAFNWSGMMACRWLLALAETCFVPGVPYFLSFFYKRHELGYRIGLFVSAAPLATTFAGALAYGITSGHPGIASWKLLFIVEGIPSVLFAFVVFWYLPDSPDSATFLTEDEKQVATARAILQTGMEGKARIGNVNFKEVAQTFTKPQTFIQPLMYFSCNVSFASLPVFMPTILTTMGFTSIHAQGLTAPPYFLSFLVCILTTWIADRTGQRGLMIVALSIIGGVGYILLATVHSVGVRYFGIFLAAAGVFPAIANILPWVLNNQGTDTKRGVGIAIINIIGQCGPILGTRIYPVSERPYYVKGMSICAAFMFFNALLALLLRTYFAVENRRFQRIEEANGQRGDTGSQQALHETEVEGTVGYRYIL